MSTQRSKVPFILMMIWFGLLSMVTGGMALIGLAFANEPGGRGNPSIVDYALIFGPVIVTVILAGLCILAWQSGRTGWAYAMCAAPLLLLLPFTMFLGI